MNLSGIDAELEAIVVKHGGTVEQNTAEGRTFCYVETGCRLKAKSVIKSAKFDVVKSQWLKDCQSKFRGFRPSDMLFVTEATKAP